MFWINKDMSLAMYSCFRFACCPWLLTQLQRPPDKTSNTMLTSVWFLHFLLANCMPIASKFRVAPKWTMFKLISNDNNESTPFCIQIRSAIFRSYALPKHIAKYCFGMERKKSRIVRFKLLSSIRWILDRVVHWPPVSKSVGACDFCPALLVANSIQ